MRALYSFCPFLCFCFGLSILMGSSTQAQPPKKMRLSLEAGQSLSFTTNTYDHVFDNVTQLQYGIYTSYYKAYDSIPISTLTLPSYDFNLMAEWGKTSASFAYNRVGRDENFSLYLGRRLMHEGGFKLHGKLGVGAYHQGETVYRLALEELYKNVDGDLYVAETYDEPRLLEQFVPKKVMWQLGMEVSGSYALGKSLDAVASVRSIMVLHNPDLITKRRVMVQPRLGLRYTIIDPTRKNPVPVAIDPVKDTAIYFSAYAGLTTSLGLDENILTPVEGYQFWDSWDRLGLDYIDMAFLRPNLLRPGAFAGITFKDKVFVQATFHQAMRRENVNDQLGEKNYWYSLSDYKQDHLSLTGGYRLNHTGTSHGLYVGAQVDLGQTSYSMSDGQSSADHYSWRYYLDYSAKYSRVGLQFLYRKVWRFGQIDAYINQPLRYNVSATMDYRYRHFDWDLYETVTDVGTEKMNDSRWIDFNVRKMTTIGLRMAFRLQKNI